MNWGSKAGTIDRYMYRTVALEVKKIRVFAVIFYFIDFRFRRVQHKTLQVRCGLCKCAADLPLLTCFSQFLHRRKVRLFHVFALALLIQIVYSVKLQSSLGGKFEGRIKVFQPDLIF